MAMLYCLVLFLGGRTLAMAPSPRCHGLGGTRLTVCHGRAAYRDKL